MLTIDDLHAQAWVLMSATTPKLHKPNPDAAIYKYWLTHKEVGTAMTDELQLADGTVAVITSTGRILHWLGGEDVAVE